MKAIIISVAVAFMVGCTSAVELNCKSKDVEMPTKWKDMEELCVNATRAQIQEELNAAITYMAMGAHFAQDTVNRPGFAKMFFESASEEREHAIALIKYLLMRGDLIKDLSSLINTQPVAPAVTSWNSGNDAMKGALELETYVTGKIKHLIKACESSNGVNDYHLVDYLTGVYLEEQYKGQREFAGKISTLGKMMEKHGALGEFLFDKKLLEA